MYRYSRQWAQTNPLGIALVQATRWQHAVPRVGRLYPHLSTPMPRPRAHDFRQLCEQRAGQLWAAHDELLVAWSGGLDSTLVAALLQRYQPAGKTLWLSYSDTTQADAPEYLAELVQRGARLLSLAEARQQNLFWVTGYHADSILIGEYYDALGEDLWSLSLDQAVARYAGLSLKEASRALNHLEPLLQQMPVERTVTNVAWWLDFATFWDRDEYDAHYRLGLGLPGEGYTSFFATQEWQEWSQQDTRVKCGPGQYKQLYRDLLEEVLGVSFSLSKNTLGLEDGLQSQLFSPNLLAIREDYSLIIASL